MSTDMLYSLDKISSLPEEVMVDILHRLPIREAVKTSLLSSSWRYRWMSMPNLVFDARSLPAEAQKDSDQVKFVTNALLLHNGIISKFEVNNFLMHGCSDVDRWILVLSRENLNHLVLVFNQQNPYQFLKMETAPERLNFNFDHLTALELVVNFEDFKEIVAVLCLLRSSPFLKSLTVTYAVICGRQSLLLYNTQFWEALLCKQDVFHSLETVSIVGFTGGLHECGFTKFILLKSMVLKTFTIKWEKSGLLPEGKLLVVEKMMQFQRSSTKAKVIFSS
ncbi:hypothetical protein IFM89_015746 [Coptis chinensis]|uniref:F-box domain-containing protein n=1 Tax=Coptis chinensis TaxID=261450 RepID=A0A835I0E6_9MAGN|nr:hypothetical protein IFM89_015746 [Coptis chinensis]